MIKNVKTLIAGSGNTTGINIIRCLKDRHINVLGMDYAEINPANKFCKNFIVPNCSDPNYFSFVFDIIKKHKITHIFTSNDHDTRILSEKIEILKKENVILNGYGVNTINFLNKSKTTELFQINEILTPEFVHSDTDFPYVLRKNDMGNEKKFVYMINSEDKKKEIPLLHYEKGIKTRFIDGYEYTIDILCDNISNILSVVPRLRREVRFGMVYIGEIVYNKELISKSKELSKKLKLTGVNCVQCIENDKNFYFTEVNPRPGSGLDLTIKAGVNMPLIWIQSSIGKPIDIPEPKWGLKMVRYYDAFFF